MKLYISHSAGKAAKNTREGWFIVEPRHDPKAQIDSLREAGRVVIEIDIGVIDVRTTVMDPYPPEPGFPH